MTYKVQNLEFVTRKMVNVCVKKDMEDHAVTNVSQATMDIPIANLVVVVKKGVLLKSVMLPESVHVFLTLLEKLVNNVAQDITSIQTAYVRVT